MEKGCEFVLDLGVHYSAGRDGSDSAREIQEEGSEDTARKEAGTNSLGQHLVYLVNP